MRDAFKKFLDLEKAAEDPLERQEGTRQKIATKTGRARKDARVPKERQDKQRVATADESEQLISQGWQYVRTTKRQDHTETGPRNHVMVGPQGFEGTECGNTDRDRQRAIGMLTVFLS
jgi:hypothetical protein